MYTDKELSWKTNFFGTARLLRETISKGSRDTHSRMDVYYRMGLNIQTSHKFLSQRFFNKPADSVWHWCYVKGWYKNSEKPISGHENEQIQDKRKRANKLTNSETECECHRFLHFWKDEKRLVFLSLFVCSNSFFAWAEVSVCWRIFIFCPGGGDIFPSVRHRSLPVQVSWDLCYWEKNCFK